MTDKYDKNGYGGSAGGGDFKRNASSDGGGPQMSMGAPMKSDIEGESNEPGAERAGEYMRELLAEKIKIDQTKFPISTRLIDQGDPNFRLWL